MLNIAGWYTDNDVSVEPAPSNISVDKKTWRWRYQVSLKSLYLSTTL
jgi:hypothetical protein